MENDIVKGIASALRSAFGGGVRIYQDDIEQGLQTPCFFILPLQTSLSPLGKDRFLLGNPFDIHFFPEDEKQNSSMQKTAWQMWQALEFISLPGGDKLHGTSVSWEVQDGVLQYCEQLQSTTGAQARADGLLRLYNTRTRSLTISGAFGDPQVKAGCSIIVSLALPGVTLSNYMVVQKVTHTLNGERHTMDLTLIGGEFISG